MRKKYDFSKSTKNPYAELLKKPVTIRLAPAIVDYFKSVAAATGIPYQSLINLYLRECVENRRKPVLRFAS